MSPKGETESRANPRSCVQPSVDTVCPWKRYVHESVTSVGRPRPRGDQKAQHFCADVGERVILTKVVNAHWVACIDHLLVCKFL